MEIYEGLFNFFALSALVDATTFPEFISAFCNILLSVFLVIYIFKVVFYTCFRIERIV